jgi:oligopeptide/dipeptide ABC transporter ATP-binding protein
MEEDSFLTVRDLKTQFFTYEGTVQALDGVNFQVKENEAVGLVGETGCGKSVTALSILRLVRPPGYIVAGEILYKKENLLSKTEQEMRTIRGKGISMVFQDPTNCLNPVMKVGDQISELFIHHQKSSKSEARKETLELMENLDLPDARRLYGQYPHEFSGGMRQRIMLAIALGLRPGLVIFDEPTTNLDVTTQAEILEYIKQLEEKYEMASIWITHNLGIVANMCDRVAVMYAGSVVEVGGVSKVLLNPAHPYTQMLQKCVPRLNQEKKRLEVISGTVPDLTNPPKGCRFHPRCPLAMEKCKTERPGQMEIGREHLVACWLHGK